MAELSAIAAGCRCHIELSSMPFALLHYIRLDFAKPDRRECTIKLHDLPDHAINQAA